MKNLHANDYNVPVSISDLHGHYFCVEPETPTEKVVAELENQPDLPGVMIIDDRKLVGVITRLKLFERLGHRFGVELFLQKPIIQLKDLVRTNIQIIPANARIDETIHFALSRPIADIYDPVVVQEKNGSLRLVDINLLLIAQSRAMASLSNVVGNLEQIDMLIKAGHDQTEIFNKILQLLRQVVPFHQAAILLENNGEMKFCAYEGYRLAPQRSNDILRSVTYQLICTHRQAIYIPNARNVPGWQGLEAIGSPLAWIGIPILDQEHVYGLLSLSRNVERAFGQEERETARAFAQRITNTIKKDGPLIPLFQTAGGAIAPHPKRPASKNHDRGYNEAFSMLFEAVS